MVYEWYKLITTHEEWFFVQIDDMQMKLTWKQRLSCFIKGRFEPALDQTDEALELTGLDRERGGSAKQLLSILQKKGRLLDFLSQNLDHYSNDQVANVARVVHDQCKKALYSYCEIKPIYSDKENSEITIEENYDKYSVDLIGNVNQQKKMTGKLIHQGWKVEKITLPNVALETNLDILQPAEVEVL